jgi:eukaryotic-like serine/threonine-protein kinase
MPDPQWENLKELFHAALALPPHERAAYLDRASGDDAALRRAVESLLKSHEQSDNFVDSPAYRAAAEMLIDGVEFKAGQAVAHYQIVSLLGEGGMGKVYLAQDTKLNRQVALKFLSTNFIRDHERLRRFEQEARAASGLNHPNILTIYEIGQAEGHRFIATEFIDGATLRDRLPAGLDLNGAVEIAIQIASALVAAHRANIVHRDIKPDNIMIRSDDDLVKILDFGLAKMSVPRVAEIGTIDQEAETRIHTSTAPGVVMGTLAYMSPEQARGDTVDARTDIWSLGVVLYEMIAGCSPFVGLTSNEIISGILSKEPAPALARYAPLVPEALHEIVDKALTKKRDERYQTSKDLLIDLKRLKSSLVANAGTESSPSSERAGPSSPQSSNDANTVRFAEATHSLHPQSSAEYIASQIGRHRLLWLGLLGLFLISGVGLALYKYRGSINLHRNRFSSTQKLTFTKLTKSGVVRDVTISPDGRYAAYSVIESGKNSLRLRQTATNSDVEIIPPGESSIINLSFTRDSNYLYYVVYIGFEGTLFQIPAFGGTPKMVASKVCGGAATSPDGKTIAYIRIDQKNVLLLANLDGSNERTLLTLAAPKSFAYFQTPAWSPDGKTLATGIYVEQNDKRLLRLFGVTASDASQRELSDRNWNDKFAVEWLADGNLIVSGSEFSDAQSPPTQLWLIAPNTEPQRVTNDLNDYYGVRATANGDALITLQQQVAANFWIAPNGDAVRARQVAPASDWSDIRWTPDGKLTFVANKDIWTVNADGSGKRQLTNNQGVNHFPSTTPDGRYIVYVSDHNNISHVWRMDADGSNQKQLVFGYQQWSPGISPDGKWVIYEELSNQKEEATVWKVSIEGGTPIQLSTSNTDHLAVSPRDGTIALDETRDGISKITLIEPSEGKLLKTLTLKGTQGYTYLRWTPDGRAIALTMSRDNYTNIGTVAVDGNGQVKPLTNFTTESIFDFSWSADGNQMAFLRGTAIRDAVLISENK